MRTFRERAASALTVALLTFGGARAFAAQGARAPADAPRVAAILLEADPREPDAATGALAALEARPAASLFYVLEAGVLEPPDGPATELDPAREELVLAALAARSAEAIERLMIDATREPIPGARSLALVKLIGATSDGSAMGSLLRLGARALEDGLDAEAVGPPLTRALARLLERDGRAFAGLRPRLLDAAPELSTYLVEGVREARSFEALELLVALLDSGMDCEELLLESVADVAEGLSPPFDARLARAVRERLDAPEAGLRAAAARALGRLEDSESVEALIRCLDADSPQVRGAAHEALRRVSGCAYAGDARRWRSWHETEVDWWRTRSAQVLSEVPSAPAAELVPLLAEVCARGLRRHELAQGLLPLLERDEPGVRALACQALAQLGSEAALPELAERLHDFDELVRGHAHAALGRLTGLELPPDAETWKDALLAVSTTSSDSSPRRLTPSPR